MRQRALFGSRWTTLGWLATVVLACGTLVWASVGLPNTSLAQEAKKAQGDEIDLGDAVDLGEDAAVPEADGGAVADPVAARRRR